MKKFFIILLFSRIAFSSQSQNYFQANVKKNGANLEFYLRLLPGGANVSIKFDDINFQIRWPDSEVAPATGTIVVNTVDFPGLVILEDPYGVEGYGSEVGYKIKQFTPPSVGSNTSSAVIYNAGQEYLVFTVAVSNVISNNIELCGNNEDGGAPYYFSVTKNGAGGATQSDYTSHNTFNGNLTNQLFYAANPGQLTTSPGASGTTNFFQKLVLTVVPVQFSKINANCNSNGALISWTTTQETNTNYFDVEKSIDGGVNWKTINTVSAIGNSSSSRNYQQQDLEGGIAVYRIKQVDKDGRFTITEILNLNCENKNITSIIYPVPAHDVLNVVIKTNKAAKTQFAIYDPTGKLVKSLDENIIAGNNNFAVDLRGLPTGDYFIRSNDPSLNFNKKFTILK
ncbi:MAG: T9SS type A sorting domain-containing protein [Ferruginibacter sp.]